jgi:aminoglycoside phosphotransferase (APT) family kinase protein
VTDEQLAAALERALPDVRVRPLRVLDTGFGSTVVETADAVVVRIARGPRAAAGHARELALLPALAGRLPVAVPEPRWRLEPDPPELPFGAIAYPKLPGAPLSPRDADDALAADVAAFLRALHATRDLELPPDVDDLEALRDATTPVLRRELTGTEWRTVDRWWDGLLGDERLRGYEPRLRHGDLWYENLLVGDGRLVGVVDWEAAGLGDPAQDFAALRHLGDGFDRRVLAVYGAADPDLPHRIERRWQLRELDGVRLSVELGDAEELAEALRKLRAGPILAARGAGSGGPPE